MALDPFRQVDNLYQRLYPGVGNEGLSVPYPTSGDMASSPTKPSLASKCISAVA